MEVEPKIIIHYSKKISIYSHLFFQGKSKKGDDEKEAKCMSRQKVSGTIGYRDKLKTLL